MKVWQSGAIFGIFMSIPSIVTAQSVMIQKAPLPTPFFLPYTMIIGFLILIILNAIFIFSPFLKIEKKILENLIKELIFIMNVIFLISFIFLLLGIYPRDAYLTLTGIIMFGFYLILAYMTTWKEGYKKISYSIGAFIILISIMASILILYSAFYSSDAWITEELEFNSRREAFYNYYLPLLLLTMALLVFGTMGITSTKISKLDLKKRSLKPLKIELSLLVLLILFSYLFSWGLLI